MSGRAPLGQGMLEVAVRSATLVTLLMFVVSVHATLATAPPAAADGAQASPALRPERVESPADAFSLLPPADARCEEEGSGRSGADGWRWHTFIVEAGRDLSTLEFGPFGPGSDYDATDGQITASLIASGSGVWSEPPAEQPKGLINPGDLGGLALDPSDYTLRDGRYLLGFACTDDASATRQWWSLEVTVQTSGAPYLTAGTAGTDSAAAASDAAGATSTTAAVGAAPTLPGSPASAVAADDGVAAAAIAADGRAVTAPIEDAPNLTGVSWSPMVAVGDASSVLPVGAWAALVTVFARISYLLARPLRVVPLVTP